MPPPPRSPDDHPFTDDLAKLTDGGATADATIADVKLLYLIVKEGERLQNAGAYPLGALFGAYERVVRDLGLDPLETFYFRFLLKFGEIQRPDTLYGKFERLLTESGISLELDDGDIDLDRLREELRSLLHQELEDGPTTHGAHPVSPPKATRRASLGSFGDTLHDPSLHKTDHRPRRASFSSFYDAGDEATQRHDRHLPRQRRRDWQSSGEEDIPSSERRRLDYEAEHPVYCSDSDPGSGVEADSVQQEPPHNQPRRSSSSNYDKQRTQPHVAIRHDITEDDPLPRFNQPPQSAEDGNPAQSPDETRNSLSTQLVSRRLPSEMSLQAEGFYRYCISTSYLKQWRAAASFHQNSALIATKYDRRIMLQEALNTWRKTLHKKRQLIETRRFFARLERRAKKARNLLLLTKAFTHWARLTEEEVQRTAVARRHMLRTKYFGAWRAIMIANELKARQFRLSKFFLHWKSVYVESLARQEDADALYKSNLTRKTYWGWLWNFFERRAPGWYEWTSKRKHLTGWFERWQSKSETEDSVEAASQQMMARGYLHKWANGCCIEAERQQQAIAYRERMLKRRVFAVWLKQSKLNPLMVRLATSIDRRVVCKTISVWRKRAEAENRARWVSRLRILRNIWTSWNDRLRCQSLAARIDERVVLIALYKWVLAERYILCRRLVESRLKQRTLEALLGRWRDRQEQYWNGECIVQHNQIKRTLQSVFSHWHCLLRDREEAASEFHARRLASRSLQLWTGQASKAQQQYQTADNARYFFLANRTIHTWKRALAVSRRRRIQAAYAKVRRRNKISLAQRALQSWRQHAADVVEMTREGDRQYHDRLLLMGKKAVEHWRVQNEHIIRMSDYAGIIENRIALRNSQRSWKDRSKLMSELDEGAAYLAERLLLKRTAALLSRLRTLAWRYCQRVRLAINFRERNESQQVRNLLKNWNAKSQYAEVADNFRRGIYLRTWVVRARQAKGKREAEKRAEETAQSSAVSRLSISLRSPPSTQTTHEVDGFPDPDYTGRSDSLFAIDGHPDDLISNLGDSINATPTPTQAHPSTPSKRPARAPGLRRPLLTPRTPHPSLFTRPQKSTGRKSFADSLWNR
ncbi:MAG: hypothetical protein M1816_000877 [Peltula sp. TS41687]|nr:MAG: hypothetical protein M1816_000877 [Peltula sp. TS41687]